MKIFLTLFLGLMLLYSCNPKVKPISFSEDMEFFEKRSENHLFSSDSTLIASLDLNASIFKNKLFFADHMGKQVLIYDTTGKFLGKVSKVGEGPSEISISVTDAKVNENGDLFVFDYSKVISFTNNLDYKFTTYTPYTITDVCVIAQSIFFIERGIKGQSPEIEIKKNSDNGTDLIRKISVKFPRLTNTEKNYLLPLNRDTLLVLIVREFRMIKISIDGIFEEQNKSIPKSFVIPTKDFSGEDGDINAISSFFRKEKPSAIYNVLKQGQYIFIFWAERGSEKTYVEIYDRYLNHIISEIEFKNQLIPLCCDEDYFYGLKPPKMRDADDIVNPTLVKYRFRYEILDSLRKNLVMKQ